MKKHILILAAVLLTPTLVAFGQARPDDGRWRASVVDIEVTGKSYDYIQPWSKSTRTVRKIGTVVGRGEILTTALGLNDHILIRLQKGGRGRWFNGEVKWLDYHANLALIGAESDSFWDGLSPLELADKDFDVDGLMIARWRSGKMETRKAEFYEWRDRLSQLSFLSYIHLRANTEADGLGAAEPLVDGQKLVGIVTGKGGDTLSAIPYPFIRPVLEAVRAGKEPRCGIFDFTWQPTRNPDTLEHLGLQGEPRGVTVIKVPEKKGRKSVLKVRDLILEVDGHAIDNEGEYEDPVYGHLTIENLTTADGRWAGDKVKIKILRDGEEKEVTYTMPAADYGLDLVPDHVFDQEPEYLMKAGLVFQPLTEDFLRRWGASWTSRAPFRLRFFRSKESTEKTPSLVVLTVVIPDPINLGYEAIRYQVVDKLNGRKIHTLKDLVAAFGEPKDGFHIVEFMKGSSAQRLVIDAERADDATQRVMARYGIPKDHYFEGEPTGGGVMRNPLRRSRGGD
jgi:hypothetical protein